MITFWRCLLASLCGLSFLLAKEIHIRQTLCLLANVLARLSAGDNRRLLMMLLMLVRMCLLFRLLLLLIIPVFFLAHVHTS